MNESKELTFSEIVGKRLEAADKAVHSLWTPLSQEFDRHGPDGAKSFLDAHQQLLEKRIEDMLSRLTKVT